MPRRRLTTLFECLFIALSAACAGHQVPHVAPNEAAKHISWEIRTGGDLGDADVVCGSAQPATPCVLTASTGQKPVLTTVHIYLHDLAQPTTYVGSIQAPFVEGSAQKSGDVNVTVPPAGKPVAATISGRVTARPAAYTLNISLDATLANAAPPQHISESRPVTVR